MTVQTNSEKTLNKYFRGRLDLIFYIYFPCLIAIAILILCKSDLVQHLNKLLYVIPLINVYLIFKKPYATALFQAKRIKTTPFTLIKLWLTQVLLLLFLLGVWYSLQALFVEPITSTLERPETIWSYYLILATAAPLLAVCVGTYRQCHYSIFSLLNCLQCGFKVNAKSPFIIVANSAVRQSTLLIIILASIFLATWCNSQILDGLLLAINKPPSLFSLLAISLLLIIFSTRSWQTVLRRLWLNLPLGILFGLVTLGLLLCLDLMSYVMQPLQKTLSNMPIAQWPQSQLQEFIQHHGLIILNWGLVTCCIPVIADVLLRLSQQLSVRQFLLSCLLNPLLGLFLLVSYYVPNLANTLNDHLIWQWLLISSSLIMLIAYTSSTQFKQFMLATLPGRATQLEKKFPLFLVKRAMLILVASLGFYYAGSLLLFLILLSAISIYLICFLLPVCVYTFLRSFQHDDLENTH